MDPSQARPDEPIAIVQGFNVHAVRALHGADHAQVERFVRAMSHQAKSQRRSLARPPIAQDRLERLEEGRVRYRFKRAFKDGTTAVDLEPFDLLARICAFVPPPRSNMVRYHGVLSSRAKLRVEVVPSPPETETEPLQIQAELPRVLEAEQAPRRKPWAWLLKHIFLHDVSVCARCQGPTNWLEVATEPDAIDQAMADHRLAPHRPRPPPFPHLTNHRQLCLPL